MVKLKLFLILIAFSFVCQGQTKRMGNINEINFKDVKEINGLVYYKLDTTLVTGRVIRYNNKKVAKRYIMVRNGKPADLGWTYVNEKKYEKPEKSAMGTLLTAAAVTTGLVMELSGNNIDVPFPDSNHIKNNNSGLIETEITPLINYNKEIAVKANDEMLQRNEISNNIQSNTYSAQPLEPKNEVYHEYFEDGQLEIKGSYFDYKKNGIWEIYYSNGKLKSKGVYSNNVKDGFWEEYYENGQLKRETVYKNGVKDGLWIQYHSNGQVWGKGHYKNDRTIGVWNYYDEKGKLILTENYNN